MNKCVVIPGHVQIKIQLPPNTPESKNQLTILKCFIIKCTINFVVIL